jgi:hypothetical protein
MLKLTMQQGGTITPRNQPRYHATEDGALALARDHRLERHGCGRALRRRPLKRQLAPPPPGIRREIGGDGCALVAGGQADWEVEPTTIAKKPSGTALRRLY